MMGGYLEDGFPLYFTGSRNLSNCDAKTIPMIAMTADAFDEDIDKGKAAGMNADPDQIHRPSAELSKAL